MGIFLFFTSVVILYFLERPLICVVLHTVAMLVLDFMYGVPLTESLMDAVLRFAILLPYFYFLNQHRKSFLMYTVVVAAGVAIAAFIGSFMLDLFRIY